MRAASYIRVSTGKQVREGLSLGEQEKLGPAYAAARGWKHVETFIEKGVSGRKSDRPALGRLLARLGEFDVVIFPKMDRLGRSAKGILDFYDTLERAGVAIVSLKPEIDTTTAGGRMFRTVLAAMAEFDSDQIGERVAAVQVGRVERGRFIGSVPPYGYVRGDDRGIEPGPHAATVRRVFSEAAGGRSQKAIARGLNADGVPAAQGGEWRQGRIGRILRNRVYIGEVQLNGDWYPGAHAPIVPTSTWESVEALLTAQSSRPGQGRGRPPKGAHLFTQGLLRCAHCGHAMAPRTDTAGRESYICLGRTGRGAAYCAQRQIPRDILDTAAFDYFRAIAFDADAAAAELGAQMQSRRDEVAGLLTEARRAVRAAEAAAGRFDDDYGAGALTAEEWRPLKHSALEALSAAQERVRLLEVRQTDLVAATAPDGLRAEVLRRVADLRAAAAAEGGLDDIRAQLLRLFERFDVGRLDLPPDDALPPAMAAARRAMIEEVASAQAHIVAGGAWVVLPWARAEIVDPLETAWRPTLGTEPQSSRSTYTPPGSWPGICWPAFYARPISARNSSTTSGA